MKCRFYSKLIIFFSHSEVPVDPDDTPIICLSYSLVYIVVFTLNITRPLGLGAIGIIQSVISII